MAKVWVKALSIVRVESNGKTSTFYPGDWCQMGKQQARDCLAGNQVEILKSAVLQSVQKLTDCAILMRSVLAEPRLGILAAKYPAVPISPYEEEFPEQSRFLLWNPEAELKHELILTGFKLLETWQMAVPLLDYNMLASDVGTEQERQATEAIIHDLRVPIYDTRVLFVRQCRETKKLFELWQDNSQLGFLQALYRSIPIVNALPPAWILH
jgi:hypothetical protein